MRVAFRLFLFVLCLVAILALAALWAAFEDQPRAQAERGVTPQQVERAMRVFRQHDPRRQWPGVARSMVLTGPDIDAGLAYAAQRWPRLAARADIRPEQADLVATVDLGWPVLGRYLNLQLRLVQQAAGLPAIEAFRVGRLRLPAFLAERLLAAGLGRLLADSSAALPAELIRRVRFQEGRAVVEYQWRADTTARLRGLAVPPAERDRLQAWQGILVRELATRPASPVSLASLLQPLLREARKRAAGGDAAAEIRALHVVLAFYVNERPLHQLVAEAKDWPRARPLEVTMRGRHDLAQHFSVSALIALAAGSPLADAVGIYKEVDDARHGSGFSFGDLAADRAGTRFGEFAAMRPQDLLARAEAVEEGAILPALDDLPEFMPEAEFVRRFGGVGAPAYVKMSAEIERRIAALSFYR